MEVQAHFFFRDLLGRYLERRMGEKRTFSLGNGSSLLSSLLLCLDFPEDLGIFGLVWVQALEEGIGNGLTEGLLIDFWIRVRYGSR